MAIFPRKIWISGIYNIYVSNILSWETPNFSWESQDCFEKFDSLWSGQMTTTDRRAILPKCLAKFSEDLFKTVFASGYTVDSAMSGKSKNLLRWYLIKHYPPSRRYIVCSLLQQNSTCGIGKMWWTHDIYNIFTIANTWFGSWILLYVS